MRIASITVCFVGLFLLSSCLNDPPTGLSFGQQLEKDKIAIDSYITSKSITGTVADPGGYGVKYKVNLAGTGIYPIVDDSVKLTYTLKLLPSETLVEGPKTVTRLLGAEIPGWQIGIPLIKEGSSATFFVPSGWGYGSFGQQNVPANSNLIYEIDLLKVTSQLKKDTIAIDAYLASRPTPILALKDPSGIRYVVTKLGSGSKPTAQSAVSISYEGRLLNSETAFERVTSPVRLELSNIIKGLSIGIQLLPVGSEATFYIPSPLGYSIYGSQGGTIPPKAILIFEVKLVGIL